MFGKSVDQSVKKAIEQRYLFNLSKHYRIWFSDNPESFLGIENQLRFIDLRSNNPEATLSFIYSSHCLSVNALDKLEKFCENHKIIPINFDTIVQELKDEQDLKLYFLAKQEIERTLTKSGGNLASAADCARLLINNIEKYGIYSDHDVNIRLSQLNTAFLSLRGPLLFSAEEMPAPSNTVQLFTNSDFLALSVVSQESSGLSEGALQAVRNLQGTIIKNYEAPFTWEKISPSLKVEELIRYPELKALLEDFYSQYADNPTIFDFRLFLSNLPEQMNQAESVKVFLTKLAVINISGPGTYPYLFKHLLPQGYKHIPTSIPVNSQWSSYLEIYQRSDIAFYAPIEKLVEHQNTLHSAMMAGISGKKQQLCDQSWTEKGKFDKHAREEKILDATMLIQVAWRRQLFWKNNCVNESVFLNIKKVCNHELILVPLVERNYELALRRACAGLRFSVVKILLEYKEKKGLHIDVNKTSETNNKTALDWVKEARTSNRTDLANQKQITELLVKAGALTAEDKGSLVVQLK